MVEAALHTVSYDELIALGSEARVEVVDGEVREMTPVGGTHYFIGANCCRAFESAVYPNKLGFVTSDGLIFLMGQRKANLRDSFVPDASYVAKAAIPLDWRIDEPYPGVPTLAVEIISPSDNGEEFLNKIYKYLTLGTDEVWAVYPHLRQVHQYRRDTPAIVRIYRADAERIETLLLPDLDLTIAAIFALPDWS